MDSLGRILLEHTDELMSRWLGLVTNHSLGKRGLSDVALKDSLPEQLRVIGAAIKAGVTSAEHLWTDDASRLDTEERVLQRVPIEEVVDEYRMAAEVVRSFLHEHHIQISFEEYSFFYEAMFEISAEAVRRYALYQAQRVEELQNSDRQMSNFLGMLSHELRNPLAPIRNCLSILERVPGDSEQGQRARSIIDRQVTHLTRLVDDLLDITRLARGKIRLQRESLDLVPVVREALEDHCAILADLEVTVELPKEPVRVDGDRARISQVIGNLLVNAAKFTPQINGKVSVSLVTRDKRAVLTVADTGIGMKPEAISALFAPFFQADRSLDRSQGGLGLGLALVKGLVEMHGGEVRAHSQGPGRGSSFAISLPVDTRVPVAAASPARTASNRGLKVLIIEDNKDAANSLCEVLTLAGHRVVVAYEGASGVDKACALLPEVVICDIGLPGEMDGYAVARALRRHPATTSARIIALTGYVQPEDRRRAEDAGFDEHLAKPPDLATLERLLATVHGSPADAEPVTPAQHSQSDS